MPLSVALICLVTLIASAVLTGTVRALAVRHGVMDVPNDRSSHSVSTPRGGGTAIVITLSAAMLVLTALGHVDRQLCAALTCGGLLVAIVGFIDDRSSVQPLVRLLIHLLAAVWALVCFGHLWPLQVGTRIVTLGISGDVLVILGIVWVLNLFNFMDGIDGLAASEASFVGIAGAVLSACGWSSGVTAADVAFGAACLGFLLWNWPPARIFMGDVGSGYLGYTIAMLVLAAGRSDPAAFWIWFILGGNFFVDATVTLVRRLTRGEAVHRPHRSHAYQWLARRWRSHRAVTMGVLGLNVLWLFPCAWFARLHPDQAPWITVGALAPLAVVFLAVGAGRRESFP